MAFILDPQTGKITFGVVADSTHDAISRDIASEFGVSETFKDNFTLDTPTFEDDFSGADNWTDTGTGYGVNTTTDQIEVLSPLNNTDNRTEFDLITPASDTQWTLRFRVNISSLSRGTGTAILAVLDSSTSSQGTADHDAIGGAFDLFTGLEGYGTMKNDGGVLPIQATPASQISQVFSTSTFYFVEIKRVSATEISTEVFTDATFTTSLNGRSTETIASTITGLRHIKFYERVLGGLTGTLNYEVDNVQFFNGTSTLTNWNSVGGGGAVNTSTQVLDWENLNIVDDNAGSFVDLVSVSDTAWVLRFKLSINEITLNAPSANFYVGMSDDNVTMAGSGTQDMIAFQMFVHQTLGEDMQGMDTDNATIPKGGGGDFALGITPTADTDYYVELKRTSGTGYELTVFSDKDYTVVQGTGTGTCSANTTGLRYLKVVTHSGVGGSFMKGTVDDVQFWNGITTPVITSNKWRMRFKLDITSLTTPSGSDVSMWIGLSDEDATSGSNTVQDAFNLAVFVDSIENFFRVSTSNAQVPRMTGSDGELTTKPAVGTFFVEMQRNSETETKVSLYTDETFTATSESITQSGISGTDNLKYLKLFNDEVPTNANEIDGTFDDFTFTDLSESLGIEETFLVDALLQTLGDNGSCISQIYTDDMSSFIGWTSTDTSAPGFAVVGGGVISWEATADGSNDTIATDLTLPSRLGKVLNDASFRVRFKNTFTTVGLLTHFNHEFMYVSDSDQTINAGTGSEDSIGFHIQIGGASPTQVVIPFYKNGSSTLVQPVGTLHTISSGSTFFYEIIRNSATSITWNVYSDPLYTALVATLTDSAVPASVGGLQYFKNGNWAFGNIANLLLGSTDDLEILTIGNTANGNVGCADIDALTVGTNEETFTVDAFIQVLGDNGCTQITFLDTIGGNSGSWTEVDVAGQIEIDLASSGVIEWNALTGGGGTTNRRAFRSIPSFANDVGRIELRVKVDKITSFAETGIFIQLQTGTADPGTPAGLTGGWIQMAMGSGAPAGVFTQMNDGTVLSGSNPTQIPFADGTTRFLQTVFDPIAQTLTVAVYTDSAFTIHDTSSPQVIDTSALTMSNSFTFDTIVCGNFTGSGTGRVITADLDDFTVITGGCPAFSIDAILVIQTFDLEFDVNAILINRIDKTFSVDTFSQAGFTEEFDIDAILKATFTETFDINALLKATQTFDFTIDGLLFITPSELICIDALVQDTFDEDFTVDTRLSALAEFTVDASIVRIKLFDIDAFAQATFDEDFLIDSRVVLRIDEEFLVDAFTQEAPQIPVEFFIDAIIRYAQGSAVGEFGAIPDLIIRVLRENGTLTGRGIVDEIVIITTAEDFPFRGKNSRIKNWLNRLRLDGLIQEDGSSPDWYKTIWSLV